MYKVINLFLLHVAIEQFIVKERIEHCSHFVLSLFVRTI